MTPTAPLPVRPRLLGATLVLLALMAMGRVLGDHFVQDDAGVIVGHPLLRHWSGLWLAFGSAYWPPANSGELYRPLSLAWFTIQWMVGGGAAWVFRIVSLALYAGSVLLTWRLLRDLVPAGAAWFAAALFAVHPVHVEAVAVGVNQSELLVAILLTLALLIHLRAARGEIARRPALLSLWILFVLGIFTKEHALVLPGLLVAADLFLDRSDGGPMARVRRSWVLYAAMAVSGALFWMVRTAVLGSGAGTQMAEALIGEGIAQRAYTMIGVPAEWLRLLLWPAHLQVDWNLLEWVPSTGWTLRETAGALALMSFSLGLVLAWRRRPVAAFGLAWMAIALAPVSNVLIPSGIVLAERALYLPSIGFVIVVADLMGSVEPRWAGWPRAWRSGLTLAGGLLLGLGVVRSSVRLIDWHDRPMFLATQAFDAPTSWHARIAYGLLLSDLGDTTQARVEIRRALQLRADDPLVAKPLVDRMRLIKGDCQGPVLVYQELLVVRPQRSDARGSLVACLLHLGRYDEARTEAERGIATGLDAEFFRYVVAVADSAVHDHAPAGTVHLRSIGRQVTVIGDPRANPP